MPLHQTRPQREVKFWIDESTAGTSQEVVVTSLSINNVPTQMRLLPQYFAETASPFTLPTPGAVECNPEIVEPKYILRSGICFFSFKAYAETITTGNCSFQVLLPRFVADSQFPYPVNLSRLNSEYTYPANATARPDGDTVVVDFEGEDGVTYGMIVSGAFPYR